jgi:DNA-binding NarL/FixJ family response regulator
MRHRIPTYVYATDPLSEAGIVSRLRPQPEIDLVAEDEIARAAVGTVVADAVDSNVLRVIRSIQHLGCTRVVIVIPEPDDAAILTLLEAGACGILRRAEASSTALVTLIESAARGEGSLPPDLLGRLLHQVGQLQRQVLAPRGLTMNGLTEREIDVLRLVAEGFDTEEISEKLAYSQRTIKTVIHDVTTRLCLRNRTHAVAWALREGLI